MNLSILKNPHQLNEISNLNITQDKLNDSMSHNSSMINVNRTLLPRLNQKQNNLTKVATSIIIDENLPVLNEKLKKANDYYSSKNNNIKDEINIDNVSDIHYDNRSRSPRMKFQDTENVNKSLYVSGYIKKFINQAHEENYFDENEDIFKLKNCKIKSKGKIMFYF